MKKGALHLSISRKLYEIDADIENCLDLETGEFDDIKFNALQQERKEKINGVICLYKNTVAFAKALKEQEDAFKERRQSAEKQAESLKDFIARALDGEKFESVDGTASFRKSKSVVCSDDFVRWAQDNDRDDLLTYKEPTANKTAIKDALKAGDVMPAEIVESLNITIK